MNWRRTFQPHRFSSLFKSRLFKSQFCWPRLFVAWGFGLLALGGAIALLILTPNVGAQKKKPTPTPANPATLEVLNREGTKVDSLVDGDLVKLKVTLNQPSQLANVASFKFADDEHDKLKSGELGCGKDHVERNIELADLLLGLQVRRACVGFRDGYFKLLPPRLVVRNSLLHSIEHLP